MKKKSLFLGMLAMTFALVVAGCDNGSTDVPDSGGDPGVFEAVLLQAKPSPASTTATPKVLASHAEGGSNYYLVDVGHISDMYISTIAMIDYTGVPMDFAKTITNTASYTTSLTETVSKSVTVSSTLGVKKSIGAEIGAKLGILNFAVKSSLETSWSGTLSNTTTRSTSNTATTATTYSEAQVYKYQFGANEYPHGRYRYAIYGVCDVYFIIKTSQDNQTLQGWETFVCARPNDYFLRSEYSTNGVFTSEPTGTIDFDENFWKELASIPITDTSLSPIDTGFEMIRTDVKKITDSGRFNQPFDAVNFNDVYGYNVTTLKQQGYQTVSFYIQLNVREVSNNGGQYIFLFKSPAQSNNYLVSGIGFEHSSGKDTSWWVHYEQELKFEDISLDSFTNEFIIRYGASGSGNDDWENKDLKIKLVFKE